MILLLFNLFLSQISFGQIINYPDPNSLERLDNPDERGNFTEGDMRFPISGKSGLVSTRFRWPNGEIPFHIGIEWNQFERDIIYSAMRDLSRCTCIRFVPRTFQWDYIKFQKENSGCWSYIGKIGGGQALNLASECIEKGIVIHEIIHAIGFEHEQSRSDRDSYVRINWQNIPPNAHRNFESFPNHRVDPFGVGYDYNSIMHYSAYAFSSNRQPTIVPLNGGRIGQREGLSMGDARKINNMYNCRPF